MYCTLHENVIDVVICRKDGYKVDCDREWKKIQIIGAEATIQQTNIMVYDER